jgi:hypothetical protein
MFTTDLLRTMTPNEFQTKWYAISPIDGEHGACIRFDNTEDNIKFLEANGWELGEDVYGEEGEDTLWFTIEADASIDEEYEELLSEAFGNRVVEWTCDG